MSELEYFELRYLEEIDSLFKEFQEITRAYNLDLFHTMNKDNSSELFNFIFKSIKIHEEEIEEDDIFNEEDEYS